MANDGFVAFAAFVCLALVFWGIRTLHRERWQFLAVIPWRRLPDGRWEGLNLTYYGLFNALAHGIAVAFLFILAGAVGVAPSEAVLPLLILMTCCVPASSLLARWIEKKPHTFTVGGASFVGIVLAPLAVWVVFVPGRPDGAILLSPILAAMAIAYGMGEGIGRLACISFGCCYGKPLAACGSLARYCFRHRGVVFQGSTRKIAYERGLEGQAVVPVQAVTSLFYVTAALVGAFLFLRGLFGLSFLFVMVVTQGWRVFSETLRADERGGGIFSAYQWLALAAAAFAVALLLVLPASSSTPDIRLGLVAICRPLVLLTMACWMVAIFLYTGVSRVTGSHLSFFVFDDRI